MNLNEAIKKIRNFNRFYTSTISVLDQDVLKSGFSLAEARILFEIKALGPCSARRIMEELTIDEGYLSRIVKKLVIEGWVEKVQSDTDQRQFNLALSEEGIKKMKELEWLSNQANLRLIEHLSEKQRNNLLDSMTNIQKLLEDR